MKYTHIQANPDLMISEHIVRDNEDGSISYIPCSEDNSDYQVYLESLEPKAKAPKVVDEAAPE
jgi:hypothetical protein